MKISSHTLSWSLALTSVCCFVAAIIPLQSASGALHTAGVALVACGVAVLALTVGHAVVHRANKKRIAGLSETVDELTRVKESLRLVSKRLKLATESANIGLWDWDIVRNELHWDDTMYRLFGVKKEDFVGTYDAWARALHPDDRAATEAALHTAIKDDNGYTAEFRVIRADGTIRTISATAKIFHDVTGKSIRVVGVNRDVTDESRAAKKMKASLKESNELKDAIDEHAIVGITNSLGEITYVNNKFCEISLFSREELIGHGYRIIGAGYHPKEFMRNLWMTISQGKIWHGEIKNKKKDGSFFWANTTIIPVLNELGKPRQYIAIQSEITKFKAVEEELQKITLEHAASVGESTALRIIESAGATSGVPVEIPPVARLKFPA
jgi:PAS domain S-box-containing protein